MKLFKNPVILSCCVFALCALGSANAQIINIQINPSNTGHGGSAPDAYTGQGSDTNATVDSGLSPQPAYYWNQAQGGSQTTTTGPALLDTTGASTAGVTSTDGASFSISTPAGEYNNGYYENPASDPLYDGYAFDSTSQGANPLQNHTISFDISGLDNEDGKSFSLYLYGNTAAIALANANSTGSGSSGTIASVYGELTLTGVVDANGMIKGTINIPAGDAEADFSGVQLDFTPAQTPEPTAWALILGGLGFLALITRRRSTPVL